MRNNRKKQAQFTVIIALLILSIIFWDYIFLYPVKLFVVFLHELSHGLTAIATGGTIVSIEIDERIGGICYTRGGLPFLVVSSGYLGSMVLGGAIFLIAQKSGAARFLGWCIALGVALTTLLFIRNGFGIAFGALFGAVLIIAAKYLNAGILETALQYLGAMSCLYALVDIKEDLLTLQTRTTDAAILAEMTGIPAIAWGALWAVIALGVFLFILFKAYKTAWR